LNHSTAVLQSQKKGRTTREETAPPDYCTTELLAVFSLLSSHNNNNDNDNTTNTIRDALMFETIEATLLYSSPSCFLTGNEKSFVSCMTHLARKSFSLFRISTSPQLSHRISTMNEKKLPAHP